MEFVVSQFLRSNWSTGLGDPPPAAVVGDASEAFSWLQDRAEMIRLRAAPQQAPGLSGFAFWLAPLRQAWNDFKADPKAFFISQFKSAFNTREDTPGNGNCGPTCLAMVAMAFNKLQVTPDQADQVIEKTRIAMTGKNNQMSGTSISQLSKGAAFYGLASRQVGGSLSVLQQELVKGRLPICLIKPAAMGLGSRSQGHYVVVTKIDAQGVHCNDPAKKSGPVVFPLDAFVKGWKAKGSLALSVGP